MYREDSLTSQFVATLGAWAGGYLLESWQKAKPGDALPVVAEIATLVGGAVGRNVTHHPILREGFEALYYGSAWGLGRWTADITTTLGGHGAGVAPTWMPGSASTSSSGWEDTLPADLVTPLPPTQPTTTEYHYTRRRVAV